MLATFLSCLALTAAAVSAEETSSEERVAVNTRPMSSEKRTLMESKRAQGDEEPSAEENQPLDKTDLFSSSSFEIDFFYPLHFHWLCSVGQYGECVEMEDGSHWAIAADDVFTLNNWRSGDLLSITPYWGVDSRYAYYVSNKSNGSRARANLFVGPYASGPYTHRIVAIDRMKGQLFLENGSSWRVAPLDYYLFNDWAIDDTLIIGDNEAWLSSYTRILINVNINNHVRAKQF
jgi:hypothetical protein